MLAMSEPKLGEILFSRVRASNDPLEGWTWLKRGHRAHYFRDLVSLCGTWKLKGDPQLSETYYGPEAEDCPECTRLTARRESGL